MTKHQGGASLPMTESYDTFLDGYRDDVSTVAVPIIVGDDALGCYQVLVQNDPSSPVSIRVGTRHSQSVLITPGQSETIPYVGKLSDIYVIAIGGTARVNWHAMR